MNKLKLIENTEPCDIAKNKNTIKKIVNQYNMNTTY